MMGDDLHANKEPVVPSKHDPLPWYIWAGIFGVGFLGIAFLLISIVGGASSDMHGNSW